MFRPEGLASGSASGYFPLWIITDNFTLVAGGHLSSHSVISGVKNLSLHKPIFNVAVNQNLHQHPIDGDSDLLQ